MNELHDQGNFPRAGRHRNPGDRDGGLRAAPAAGYDDYDDYRGDDRADRPADSGGGMPLRGLAMICIFIGVCLMGWGLYAWTSGGENGDGGEGGDGTVAEAPAAGAPGTGDRPGGDQSAAGPGGRPDAEAPAPPPAPAAPGEIRRADYRITVLNNSNEQGLAASVSDSLSREGWGRGATGNAAEGQTGIWERTTVHYNPGNAAEKAAAEQIARDNGWDVAPRDQRLSSAPGGIIVVTAADARR
ncbi:LytR C-terminal domain-containing protein [Corynebacterium hansenii]|uniref:LytR C-terminal domain-containing protein n=1 Tax=Corynebacterium hansenii TaxID=394964 RepID=A0ABV7ZSZ9_9CORY|nr:LytR C-terminal domain-containing protein [Corynebacterium hansenii]